MRIRISGDAGDFIKDTVMKFVIVSFMIGLLSGLYLYNKEYPEQKIEIINEKAEVMKPLYETKDMSVFIDKGFLMEYHAKKNIISCHRLFKI